MGRAGKQKAIIAMFVTAIVGVALCLPGLFIAISDQDGDVVIADLNRVRSTTISVHGKFNSHVTDHGLATIVRDNPEIEELSITQCPEITDVGLEFIGKLLKLRSLTLQLRQGFTQKGLVSLGALEHLEELNLIGLEIGYEGATHIAKLQTLKKLLVSRRLVSSGVADRIRLLLPSCKLELW